MENKKILQKIVLGGVVVNDNKILLLQRNKDEKTYPNLWELPSGKREALESSESALVREIKEECGLDVSIIFPLSVFDYQIEKPEEIRDSTQINFIVKPKNNFDVEISSEHQNFAWISEDEINNYNATDSVKNCLRTAFSLIQVLKTVGIL
jgi:8-oxo-dGTP diphosphatase